MSAWLYANLSEMFIPKWPRCFSKLMRFSRIVLRLSSGNKFCTPNMTTNLCQLSATAQLSSSGQRQTKPSHCCVFYKSLILAWLLQGWLIFRCMLLLFQATMQRIWEGPKFVDLGHSFPGKSRICHFQMQDQNRLYMGKAGHVQ